MLGGAQAQGDDGEALLAALDELLVESGLISRGGFNFLPDDAAPPGPDGLRAASVVLVGNCGADYWPKFEAWRDRQALAERDPLDHWSHEVIGEAGRGFGARFVSPSDRPFQPFQQWAMRAEGLKPSPLGILIHPRYGLWHAYRGALLFPTRFQWPEPEETAWPCDGCETRPCLKACPVGAYDGAGFAYGDCLGWVRGPQGHACRTHGCRDRNACPVGVDYRYPPLVQAFHMRAFAGL